MPEPMTASEQNVPAPVPAERRAVPAGWRWVRLGEVCEFLDSQRIPVNITERNKRIAGKKEAELFPYYGANGQVGWIDDFLFDEPLILLAEDGGFFGSCDKPIAYAVSGRSWVNNHAHVLRPKPEIDFDFCLHSLRLRPDVGAMVSGSTRAKLNQELAAGIPIALPPIPEQQRIAAILTGQMAAVERARAAAEARLEAAKALPAAYLRAVFEGPEAREWPRKRLGDVLTLRKDVVHPSDNPRGPATFVGLEHIESGTGRRVGSLGLEKSELTGRKPQFSEGDIVYGYLRPYLNKVWIAEFDGLCSVDQYVYSLDASQALGDYVAWFMRSSTYLKRAPIGLTPGQLPRIRTEEVASVEVELPSLAEQRRVADRIRREMTATDSACKAAEAELAAINALPAALLRRAFRGGL